MFASLRSISDDVVNGCGQRLHAESKNKAPSFFAARKSTESGVVTITAPNVPPSTIMAAVIWADVLDLAAFHHQARS